MQQSPERQPSGKDVLLSSEQAKAFLNALRQSPDAQEVEIRGNDWQWLVSQINASPDRPHASVDEGIQKQRKDAFQKLSDMRRRLNLLIATAGRPPAFKTAEQLLKSGVEYARDKLLYEQEVNQDAGATPSHDWLPEGLRPFLRMPLHVSSMIKPFAETLGTQYAMARRVGIESSRDIRGELSEVLEGVLHDDVQVDRILRAKQDTTASESLLRDVGLLPNAKRVHALWFLAQALEEVSAMPFAKRMQPEGDRRALGDLRMQEAVQRLLPLVALSTEFHERAERLSQSLLQLKLPQFSDIIGNIDFSVLAKLPEKGGLQRNRMLLALYGDLLEKRRTFDALPEAERIGLQNDLQTFYTFVLSSNRRVGDALPGDLPHNVQEICQHLWQHVVDEKQTIIRMGLLIGNTPQEWQQEAAQTLDSMIKNKELRWSEAFQLYNILQHEQEGVFLLPFLVAKIISRKNAQWGHDLHARMIDAAQEKISLDIPNFTIPAWVKEQAKNATELAGDISSQKVKEALETGWSIRNISWKLWSFLGGTTALMIFVPPLRRTVFAGVQWAGGHAIEGAWRHVWISRWDLLANHPEVFAAKYGTQLGLSKGAIEKASQYVNRLLGEYWTLTSGRSTAWFPRFNAWRHAGKMKNVAAALQRNNGKHVLRAMRSIGERFAWDTLAKQDGADVLYGLGFSDDEIVTLLQREKFVATSEEAHAFLAKAKQQFRESLLDPVLEAAAPGQTQLRDVLSEFERLHPEDARLLRTQYANRLLRRPMTPFQESLVQIAHEEGVLVAGDPRIGQQLALAKRKILTLTVSDDELLGIARKMKALNPQYAQSEIDVIAQGLKNLRGQALTPAEADRLIRMGLVGRSMPAEELTRMAGQVEDWLKAGATLKKLPGGALEIIGQDGKVLGEIPVGAERSVWRMLGKGVKYGLVGLQLAGTAYETFEAVQEWQNVERRMEDMRKDLDALAAQGLLTVKDKEKGIYSYGDTFDISLESLRDPATIKRNAALGRAGTGIGALVGLSRLGFGWAGVGIAVAEITVRGVISAKERGAFFAFIKNAPHWLLATLPLDQILGVEAYDLLDKKTGDALRDGGEIVGLSDAETTQEKMRGRVLQSWLFQRLREAHPMAFTDLLSLADSAGDGLETFHREDFPVFLDAFRAELFARSDGKLTWDEAKELTTSRWAMLSSTVGKETVEQAMDAASALLVDHLAEKRYVAVQKEIAVLKEAQEKGTASLEEEARLEQLEDTAFRLGTREVFGKNLRDAGGVYERNGGKTRGQRVAEQLLAYLDRTKKVSPSGVRIRLHAGGEAGDIAGFEGLTVEQSTYVLGHTLKTIAGGVQEGVPDIADSLLPNVPGVGFPGFAMNDMLADYRTELQTTVKEVKEATAAYRKLHDKAAALLQQIGSKEAAIARATTVKNRVDALERAGRERDRQNKGPRAGESFSHVSADVREERSEAEALIRKLTPDVKALREQLQALPDLSSREEALWTDLREIAEGSADLRDAQRTLQEGTAQMREHLPRKNDVLTAEAVGAGYGLRSMLGLDAKIILAVSPAVGTDAHDQLALQAMTQEYTDEGDTKLRSGFVGITALTFRRERDAAAHVTRYLLTVYRKAANGSVATVEQAADWADDGALRIGLAVRGPAHRADLTRLTEHAARYSREAEVHAAEATAEWTSYGRAAAAAMETPGKLLRLPDGEQAFIRTHEGLFLVDFARHRIAAIAPDRATTLGAQDVEWREADPARLAAMTRLETVFGNDARLNRIMTVLATVPGAVEQVPVERLLAAVQTILMSLPEDRRDAYAAHLATRTTPVGSVEDLAARLRVALRDFDTAEHVGSGAFIEAGAIESLLQ